jgi:glycosyltransferase involved in cell wall biosynthesis
VHHGLPRDLHRFREGSGGYLAFLGRISPEKRLDRAIEIARLAGRKLKIAARVYKGERDYVQEKIEPLLREHASFVEFIGEVGGREKDEFLGNAEGLLFPIDWPEPFGLVMIEAMACGTPVIAWRCGSVPEVVEEGVSGYIIDSIEEGVEAVRRLQWLDRQACRRAFESRFDAPRMAADYLKIYRHQLHAETLPAARRLRSASAHESGHLRERSLAARPQSQILGEIPAPPRKIEPNGMEAV